MKLIESLESRSLFSVSVDMGGVKVPTEVSAGIGATARDTIPQVVGVYAGESRTPQGLRRGWLLRITAQEGRNFTGSLTLRNAAGQVLGVLEMRGKVGAEGRMMLGAVGTIRVEGRELRARVEFEGRIGPAGNAIEGKYGLTAANASGVVHRDVGAVRLIKQIAT